MLSRLYVISVISILGLSIGCSAPALSPLIGEDPEISALLGTPPPADPSNSPLAAARRLHQALVQQDTELAWTLLAGPTREALNARGALIGTNGRELLDASTLPAPDGTVRKIRYEALFFGAAIASLRDAEKQPESTEKHQLLAIDASGASMDLTLVLEEDGWKLLKTQL